MAGTDFQITRFDTEVKGHSIYTLLRSIETFQATTRIVPINRHNEQIYREGEGAGQTMLRSLRRNVTIVWSGFTITGPTMLQSLR